MKSKNRIPLNSFIEYCKKNPSQRFWQALKNWSGYCFVLVANEIEFPPKGKFTGIIDTFFFTGRED